MFAGYDWTIVYFQNNGQQSIEFWSVFQGGWNIQKKIKLHVSEWMKGKVRKEKNILI